MKLKFNRLKFIGVFITISLVIVLFFRKPIMESKLGKAKMDILQILMKEEPAQAKEDIKGILDSIFIEPNEENNQ